ncbi:MAG: GAF domain-containing protein [Gemmatimonadales bacterium]
MVSFPVLDHATRLAARELEAPVGCVSVVGADGRLRTGSYGLPPESALLVSWLFVKRVVATGQPLVVPDGRQDPVAALSSAVRDGTVMAYVGVPLITPSGTAVGTLSVLDRKPRPWTATQLNFLWRLTATIARAVGPDMVGRRRLAVVR